MVISQQAIVERTKIHNSWSPLAILRSFPFKSPNFKKILAVRKSIQS